MKEEEKKLLIKDLCARLPYGVKCRIKGERSKILVGIDPEGLLFRARTPDKSDWCYDCYDIEEWSILPYLRPMSSMTEQEAEEYNNLCFCNTTYPGIAEDAVSNFMDWLNSHHFDYRGLIEKGLALEAPKDMYKFK
jgi:hypothetical protein